MNLGIRYWLIGYFDHYVREFLCVGAVNGDGHIAPVCAKVVARITKYMFQNTCSKIPGACPSPQSSQVIWTDDMRRRSVGLPLGMVT